MDIAGLYRIFKACGRVATDTRTLKGGELFFALKGENFDGNEYALKALESGASYAVVDEKAAVAAYAASDGNAPGIVYDAQGLCRLIPVPDTLRSLQELARWHRSMTFVNGRPLPVLALTGTNGKTTTKELVRQVLSTRYQVTATEGNLNNSIGVPLTLLSISEKTEIAVVEMGASHPGDIKELVDIALPNYGLITNVGKAHLLGFGSFEGVKKTKGELYDYLRRTGDMVFLNADNPHLCSMASERNLHSDPERSYSLVIPYGLEYSGSKVLESSPEQPFLRIELQSVSSASDSAPVLVNTNLVGSYNADNVMAALAVGQYFGVSLEDAVKAVSDYIPSNNRSQMVKTACNTLIVDAYNANPTSMSAALDNFSSVRAGCRIAMLGDMLELGAESLDEHTGIVRKALCSGLDVLYLAGAEFENALSSMSDDETLCKWKAEGKIHSFPDSEALKSYLKTITITDAMVLIKGSRGSRMEKVLEVL